jgi:hypothetical protein
MSKFKAMPLDHPQASTRNEGSTYKEPFHRPPTSHLLALGGTNLTLSLMPWYLP